MAKRSSASPAPWDRDNPKKKEGGRPKTMTSSQKGEARARARQAGRPYPNLIDNMAVAKKGRTGTSTKKAANRTTKKRSA